MGKTSKHKKRKAAAEVAKNRMDLEGGGKKPAPVPVSASPKKPTSTESEWMTGPVSSMFASSAPLSTSTPMIQMMEATTTTTTSTTSSSSSLPPSEAPMVVDSSAKRIQNALKIKKGPTKRRKQNVRLQKKAKKAVELNERQTTKLAKKQELNSRKKRWKDLY